MWSVSFGTEKLRVPNLRTWRGKVKWKVAFEYSLMNTHLWGGHSLASLHVLQLNPHHPTALYSQLDHHVRDQEINLEV